MIYNTAQRVTVNEGTLGEWRGTVVRDTLGKIVKVRRDNGKVEQVEREQVSPRVPRGANDAN